MKILVLGAGAIGGYYGARLIEAGADVTFLVRPRRMAQLATKGLDIISSVGNFNRQVATVTAVSADDDFDLVLLTCKGYDLRAAVDAISPAMTAGAVVLPFCNGLGAYDCLDERFGVDKVMGGVAYIATTMDDDGVIHHLAAADTMVIGHRSDASVAIADAFFGLVSKTQGSRTRSGHINQALWDKWVLLASGGAVCSLLRGNLQEILATASGEQIMREAIRECAAVAAASGYRLSTESMQWVENYLIAPESTWAASLARDIGQNRKRLEADAIVGDMLARAVALDVPAPVLDIAFAHLQVYTNRHAEAALG